MRESFDDLALYRVLVWSASRKNKVYNCKRPMVRSEARREREFSQHATAIGKSLDPFHYSRVFCSITTSGLLPES